MLLATSFGTGDVFWSMLWFFLWIIWIWMLIAILTDVFRSPDLGGWGKALWTIFVVVLPFLGVFVYLIARGNQMGERAVQQAAAREAQMRSYVTSVAGSSSPAQEIKHLAELRDAGTITEEEFQQAKARALA